MAFRAGVEWAQKNQTQSLKTCEQCAGQLSVIDHVTKEREELRKALDDAAQGLGIYHRSAKRALGEKV